MQAKIGWMLVAKASEDDLRCVDQVTYTMEAIEHGRFPDEICVEEVGEPFDVDNVDHCQRVVRHLLDIARTGSIGRAATGLRVMFDPRSEVLAPGSEVLELHPRLAEGLASGWVRLTRAGQVKVWDYLTFKLPHSDRRYCALVSHVEYPGTDREEIRYEIAYDGSNYFETSKLLCGTSILQEMFVLSRATNSTERSG